jgi:hypothetical protein
MSPAEVDHSIELTLGNFNDAAPLFGSDTKQFIGITNYPTTPIATRQMPPLAYPQPKQSSSAFNSNGITPSQSSAVNSSSRTSYNNNNNNNTINNNNNPAINNVNSYPTKLSSSALLQAPSSQSRANNSNSITSLNSNTFARPPDTKPPINGRSNYASASQLNKHEVNITFSYGFVISVWFLLPLLPLRAFRIALCFRFDRLVCCLPFIFASFRARIFYSRNVFRRLLAKRFTTELFFLSASFGRKTVLQFAFPVLV